MNGKSGSVCETHWLTTCDWQLSFYSVWPKISGWAHKPSGKAFTESRQKENWCSKAFYWGFTFTWPCDVDLSAILDLKIIQVQVTKAPSHEGQDTGPQPSGKLQLISRGRNLCQYNFSLATTGSITSNMADNPWAMCAWCHIGTEVFLQPHLLGFRYTAASSPRVIPTFCTIYDSNMQGHPLLVIRRISGLFITFTMASLFQS